MKTTLEWKSQNNESDKWRVQKKNSISPPSIFKKKKKNSISRSDLKVTHNSAHATDPDPSLGVLGRNFMEIPNIGSVRSGSVGIPIRALRPKLPVWSSNSWLRVARTILIADLESTQKFGVG